MGQQYRLLTEQDRAFLQIMLDKGYTKVRIAMVLGVHRSTVHREFKRNSVKYWYKPEVKYYYSIMAHQAYLKRRKKGLKLEKNQELQDYVHAKLKSGWSPWQIEGRLKVRDNALNVISHSLFIVIFMLVVIDATYFISIFAGNTDIV